MQRSKALCAPGWMPVCTLVAFCIYAQRCRVLKARPDLTHNFSAVRDARVEKLASTSQEILHEHAFRCSVLQENDIKERQELRYSLLALPALKPHTTVHKKREDVTAVCHHTGMGSRPCRRSMKASFSSSSSSISVRSCRISKRSIPCRMSRGSKSSASLGAHTPCPFLSGPVLHPPARIRPSSCILGSVQAASGLQARR